MEMTAKRQRVTKDAEKLSQEEQLVPGHHRYTRDTFCSKLDSYLANI